MTISDADLVRLPRQRPQALRFFSMRWRKTAATTLEEKLGDRITARFLARRWFALARRQEALERQK